MSYKDVIVGKVTDLKDGQMRAVPAEDREILLIRIDGKYYATAPLCPHYNAPLAKGVLHGDRIVCPWHHAVLKATTGELEEPPALNALTTYQLKIEGENIVVSLPQKVEYSHVPKMATRDFGKDSRTFVIIGLGAAGYAASQTLREDGFGGRIVAITRENHLPYDRTMLSKTYLQDKAFANVLPLRPAEFFEEYGIEVMLGKKVTNVRTKDKQVEFEGGSKISYDKLLLAPGSVPRTLDVPGADKQNVMTLRSRDDCDAIIAAAEHASRVAVIGASFIGMETAFSFTKRNLPVTVISPETVPFEHVFGEKIGGLLRSLHEEKSVTFKLGAGVERFEGNGKVEAVVLKSGERVEADLVLVGIGVRPATDFLTDIPKLADGSVRVDEHFKVATDVYASGDIATFQDWRTGDHIRIEHWRTALQLGRIAAHNMAGNPTSYRDVPYFWTSQPGLQFRYIGFAKAWDDLVIDGELSEKKFLAFFVKGDRIAAVAGGGRDTEMAAIHELMRTGSMPTVKQIRGGSIDWVEALAERS